MTWKAYKELVSELDEFEQSQLDKLFSITIGKCESCGKKIVLLGSKKRKRCLQCAYKHQRRMSCEWAKRNYKSIPYEKDNYISRTGKR